MRLIEIIISQEEIIFVNNEIFCLPIVNLQFSGEEDEVLFLICKVYDERFSVIY